MTTLYRPVLIETAEQVEGLPEGAILHMPRGRWQWGLTGAVVRSPHHDQTTFRVGTDYWPVRRVLDVFAEALVPVEAEEEFFLTHDGVPFGLPMDEAAARTDAARNAHRGAGVAHRFVTLEEPA